MSGPTDSPEEPPWRASRVRYADVLRIREALDCPEPMAWILVRRGLGDPEAAREFLAVDGDLGDPEAIDGVGAAADRLVEAHLRECRDTLPGGRRSPPAEEF